jgi:hypothetical protein
LDGHSHDEVTKVEEAMLKASFVRTLGERDRIYVTRSNGTGVSWAFPTYGDVPPHDLIHLIVESAFGVTHGFWGRVDAGADPGVIAARANRMGGRDKYAAFGDDLTELQLAEALANSGWLMNDSSAEALKNQIVAVCRQASLPAPVTLSTELTTQVRSVLRHLATQWRELTPKGAIQLQFDPQDARRGFQQLFREVAAQRFAAGAPLKNAAAQRQLVGLSWTRFWKGR